MTENAAERLARALAERRLVAPARLLAESHRPIAPLLSDLGSAFGPLLQVIGGPRARGLAAFAADEEALDRLTESLNELEPPRAQPR